MTMTDLFLERSFDQPLCRTDVHEIARRCAGCFSIYNVEWVQSLLSGDGRRMFCQFISPDVESARIALRQVGAVIGALWSGSQHDADAKMAANVLVARSFPEAVTLDAVQAVEDAADWCLRLHQVSFVRTYFSRDRRRMICLYQAPDAESVRRAQTQARMPFDSIWSFDRILPAHLFDSERNQPAVGQPAPN